MIIDRTFRRLFTKTPDPLLDLDGSEVKSQRHATVFLKNATSQCLKCGGPCAVFGDTNGEGVLERLYLKCPKCGEGLTLTSKQPDSHEEVQRLIRKGVVR